MKKLFITLMTVCVIASCGGDKKNDGNNASDNTGNNTEQNDNAGQNHNPQGVQAQAGDVKTPGDLMMMAAEMLNTASDNLENAKTADQVIDALDKHRDRMNAFHNKYGKQLEAIFGQYSDEEIMEKFPTESAAAQAAIERFGNIFQEVMTLEFNDEQQKRFLKAMEKMEDASY